MAMHETVECRHVLAVIRERGRANGELALGAAMQEHVRACSACAQLVGRGAALGHALAEAEVGALADASVDIDEMFGQLEQEIGRPPSWIERVRQTSTRARSLALAGIATVMTTLAGVTLGWIDFASYPLPQLIGSIAALVAAAVAAGAAMIRPIHRSPLPGWLLGVLASFAVILPIVIASVPTVGADHPSAQLGTGEQLVPAALGCFVIGMIFALLLIAAAWLVERSGLRRPAATVLGLVGAGALGNLVLVLHCPIVAPAHKLLGHASISTVLLAVAAGVAFVLVRERRPT